MVIGEKIRLLRVQHRLTQEELANRCELSKGFISQIERDLTSPSIATLMDLLECLGTNLKDFFSETPDEKLIFGPADYPVLENETDKNKITWLVPSAQKNSMEPILVQLSPGGRTQEDDPHEGEEFGYVLAGRILLWLGGKAKKCKKGESFYYTPELPHYLENNGKAEALVLWVSTPPSF